MAPREGNDVARFWLVKKRTHALFFNGPPECSVGLIVGFELLIPDGRGTEVIDHFKRPSRIEIGADN